MEREDGPLVFFGQQGHFSAHLRHQQTDMEHFNVEAFVWRKYHHVFGLRVFSGRRKGLTTIGGWFEEFFADGVVNSHSCVDDSHLEPLLLLHKFADQLDNSVRSEAHSIEKQLKDNFLDASAVGRHKVGHVLVCLVSQQVLVFQRVRLEQVDDVLDHLFGRELGVAQLESF